MNKSKLCSGSSIDGIYTASQIFFSYSFVVTVTIFIILCAAYAYGNSADSDNTILFDPEEIKILPRYQTEAEKIFNEKVRQEFFENIQAGADLPPYLAPPVGDIIMHSEFDPIKGTLFDGTAILSGLWRDIYLAMIEFMQQVPGHRMFILARNETFKDNIIYTIEYYGLTTDKIEFIIALTDANWTRDYGPEYVTVDGAGSFIDMKYYSSRPNDDRIPQKIAQEWKIDNYLMPLNMEGGNLQSDGCGTCVYTDVVYIYNGGMTHEEVDNMIKQYYGCDRVIVLQRMLNDGGTGHVDMFFKYVDQDSVLVGQATDTQSADYQRIENNAALLASTESCNGVLYTVHRIPLVSPYYTYTNSSIVNDTILVPIYGLPEDDQALAIYETVYPGRTALGIDCTSVIDLGGAIHCVTLELPDCPDPLVQPALMVFCPPFSPQTFTIQNQGIGTFSWVIEDYPDWLQFDTESGNTTDEIDTVTVTVTEAGEKWGSFTVNTNGGDVEVLVHVLDVAAPLDTHVLLAFAILLILISYAFMKKVFLKKGNN